MGKLTYKATEGSDNSPIWVNDNGLIVSGTPQSYFPVSSVYVFDADGDDYVGTIPGQEGVSVRFVMKDNRVLKIEAKSGEKTTTFLPDFGEEEAGDVAAWAMGSKRYTAGDTERYIYVDEEGNIVLEYADKATENISGDYTFAIDGNVITATSEKVDNTFTFAIDPETSEVTKITQNSMKGSLEYTPVSAKAALIRMMGDSKFYDTDYNHCISVKEGVIVISDSDDDNELSDDLTFTVKGYDYEAYSEEALESYRFIVRDGKVVKIFEDGEEGVKEFMTVDGKIAELMGDMKYKYSVSEDNHSIFVDKGKIVFMESDGTIISLSDEFDFTRDDNGYVTVNNGYPVTYNFVVKNGKVTKVVERNPGGKFVYLPEFDDIEKQIAWLMGDVNYVHTSNNYTIKIYADSKGRIIFDAGGHKAFFADDETFAADGNNFKATSTLDENSTYSFVVENGRVTKIVNKAPGFSTEFLPKFDDPRAQLAWLMGDTKYVNGNNEGETFTIKVNNDGKIVLIEPDGTITSLSDEFDFTTDGDDYLSSNIDIYYTTFRFVVENGKVTKILRDETIIGTTEFLPVSYIIEKIAQLMGETEYVCVNGLSIYVDNEGKILIGMDNITSTLSDDFDFTTDGDDYVTIDTNNKKVTFRFVVKNGKVTKIVETVPGGTVEFLPKQETPTGSRRAELDHVGAYNFKTIENGHIVIIRGNEKYDLSGAKIE